MVHPAQMCAHYCTCANASMHTDKLFPLHKLGIAMGGCHFQAFKSNITHYSAEYMTATITRSAQENKAVPLKTVLQLSKGKVQSPRS